MYGIWKTMQGSSIHTRHEANQFCIETIHLLIDGFHPLNPDLQCAVIYSGLATIHLFATFQMKSTVGAFRSDADYDESKYISAPRTILAADTY